MLNTSILPEGELLVYVKQVDHHVYVHDALLLFLATIVYNEGQG